MQAIRPSSPLQALTVAALALPGLIPMSARAAEQEAVEYQYSHYEEGARDIYASWYDAATQSFSTARAPHSLHPITVDSLHARTRVALADRLGFGFDYTQDTWSGATPVGSAPAIAGANRGQLSGFDPVTGAPIGVITGASPLGLEIAPWFRDSKGNLREANYDLVGQARPGKINNQLTHVMSSASPETRQEGKTDFNYEWDQAAVNLGAGLSSERDYTARFVNLGGHLDFNQKRTTVHGNLSYTHGTTAAKLDPDSLQFIQTYAYDTSYYDDLQLKEVHYDNLVQSGRVDNTWTYSPTTGIRRTAAVLRGKRQDWHSQLGITQVLTKNAVIEMEVAYSRSDGYLSNPYKAVYLFGSNPAPNQSPDDALLFGGNAQLEVRPNKRIQRSASIGYHHYIEPFDAALHVSYHFAYDDWGIDAHTFETDWAQPLGFGWVVTPRVRYYSQSKADFYAPYFTTVQVVDPVTGASLDSPLNHPAPKVFSSDQRLSGYGALSGGVIVQKRFIRGLDLEAGVEYYTHQGALKLGGGGEQDFADFDYWAANASLKVDFSELSAAGTVAMQVHHHSHAHALLEPAGMMFSHTLARAGDVMLGYHFSRAEQSGALLHGGQTTNIEQTRAHACEPLPCQVAPNFMAMNMHMLDLMFAPTDWLTLMVMPQWTDMEMGMTPLASEQHIGHHHGGAVHAHETGGLGDTGMAALFKLYESSGQHLHLGLGLSAPTGKVDIQLRKTSEVAAHTPIHYGMQLGSGTWDFTPSLTYGGAWQRLAWGAQALATKRLEHRNQSDFRFGDSFEGNLWSAFQWTPWIANTLRAVYTVQGAIDGRYRPVTVNGIEIVPTHVGPFDRPDNYGGRFVDLGIGINLSVPDGSLRGNTVKLEWLEPLHTDFNGYQLRRTGKLALSWSYSF